jgi:asparaginyl-tRNA synthetase
VTVSGRLNVEAYCLALTEHERYLTEKYAKKPVIVMNYPKAIKAFYMRLNDDSRTVAAMDVLAPGIGEIIGQREGAVRGTGPQYGRARHRPRALRLVPRPAPLRHGAARRLRLGFERTLAYVTGLANVRDAIPFPRTPGSARY